MREGLKNVVDFALQQAASITEYQPSRVNHGRMVIRTRIRAILNQLALLAERPRAIAYFSYQAFNGRAWHLQAQHQFDQQKQDLGSELVLLQKEYAALDRRVNLLRSLRDRSRHMLDEKARDVLGLVHPNDEVVLLTKQDRAFHLLRLLSR